MAFFHIDRHRSKEVAQNIFGEKFDGVLIADGYAAYNGVNPEARQSCLAHLIRKAKEVKKEIMLRQEQFHDPWAIDFCDQIVALFKEACTIAKRVNSCHSQWQKAGEYKRKLYRQLKAI
ncbi:MAG: transposase [Thermodesulfobacteriota bacterium]|nr:transposase [Thermodesulfobacteriota bacterium]